MKWENQLIKDLQWSNEITNREAKQRVAREIAATAKAGDIIGAGSGSTVYLTLPTFFVSLLHVMVVVVRGIMLRLTAIIIVVMRRIRWNGTGTTLSKTSSRF